MAEYVGPVEVSGWPELASLRGTNFMIGTREIQDLIPKFNDLIPKMTAFLNPEMHFPKPAFFGIYICEILRIIASAFGMLIDTILMVGVGNFVSRIFALPMYISSSYSLFFRKHVPTQNQLVYQAEKSSFLISTATYWVGFLITINSRR